MSELPFINFINSSGYPHGMYGKSLHWLTGFQKWYADGNRIPDDVTVLYFDIERILPDDGPENSIYRMNMMYYCIKFHGYFPNATIVEKNTNGS